MAGSRRVKLHSEAVPLILEKVTFVDVAVLIKSSEALEAPTLELADIVAPTYVSDLTLSFS